MIDINNLGMYKENNRIEAKKATGGFPHSIWETYSSFANTLGGIILFGVIELDDKTLHPVDLPEPEKLVREFWETVNDPQKVSVNILTRKNVSIEEVDGKHIIVITVPRAHRYDKPVYIDNSTKNTYRRSGEGDYRCSPEEIESMIRDASLKTHDMKVLYETEMDALDQESIKRYRNRMKKYRPGHAWEELEDPDFLYNLGAIGKDRDGLYHPTAAGLLMFGYEYEIVKEYPGYFLDYQERFGDDDEITDRVTSSSGDFSGNICDFYFIIYDKIMKNIRLSSDDTQVYDAVKEAVANSLVNADYNGRRGLVIIQRKHEIRISNPGALRIKAEEAKAGGISDPRNNALMKMFNLIDIGERAGKGIPEIYSVWRKRGWNQPVIEEQFDPERITLSLPFVKDDAISRQHRNVIISYLTDNISAGITEISEVTGLGKNETRELLDKLISEDVITSDHKNRKKIFRLKE